jgi:hypothetical protein
MNSHHPLYPSLIIPHHPSILHVSPGPVKAPVHGSFFKKISLSIRKWHISGVLKHIGQGREHEGLRDYAG